MAHKCYGCRYNGVHQEMMFKPMGVCLREHNLIQAQKNYNAEKCPYGETAYEKLKNIVRPTTQPCITNYAKLYSQVEEKVSKIYQLSGLNLDDIIEKLAKGYTFVPPNETTSFDDLKDYAE